MAKFFKRYGCNQYFHEVWIYYQSTLKDRSQFSLRFLICLLKFISLWIFLKKKVNIFYRDSKDFSAEFKGSIHPSHFKHVPPNKSMHYTPVIIYLYGIFYSFGLSKPEMHSGIYTHTYCTKFSTSTCILSLWGEKKNYEPDKWMFILI